LRFPHPQGGLHGPQQADDASFSGFQMTENDRHKMDEGARDGEAERLRALANELTAIAASLLSREDARLERLQTSRALPPLPPEIEAAVDLEDYSQLSSQDFEQFAETARNIYRGRRLRPRIFADDTLFGEPAWDILLDLFIAEMDHKPLSVTAACIGAAVPTSTALRWIAILEERGFLSRENDPADARRVFLRLTGGGRAKMASYFMMMQREGQAGT
jgi:hypothetical protein